MSISDISNGFGFLGGLGMFLYGMSIMADGMQKTAGSKMSSFLGMLTNNRFLAVALGALITAIIQSSGATTVMVVGFVSAGVLNLSQAVGVIMGANIGTTITAWIVSMSQLGDAFEVLKPSFYARHHWYRSIASGICKGTEKEDGRRDHDRSGSSVYRP